MSRAEQAEQLIAADVRMISGCRDDQTSADVSNVASFSLPHPAGRAGGACTSAILEVLYQDEKVPDEDLSFQDVLLQMREVLKQGRYSQVPQLTSSRAVDMKQKFAIVPDNFSGTRRAVMIGINYVGQQGQLSGCVSDVKNMLKFIKDVHGFTDDNVTLLLDDGEHANPTYENILNAYSKLAREAQPGDAVFCHYSGHGGKIRDDNGDEKDGYDETLVPVDYASAGQIRDDDVFSTLVGPMAKGVTMTCIYDCCHSGTVLDLPYVFVGDGSQEEMYIPEDFDFGALTNLFNNFMQQHGQNIDAKQVISIVEQLCGSSCEIL